MRHVVAHIPYDTRGLTRRTCLTPFPAVPPPTHPRTHSPTHPLAHSLTHSPTRSLTHPPTHSPTPHTTHPHDARTRSWCEAPTYGYHSCFIAESGCTEAGGTWVPGGAGGSSRCTDPTGGGGNGIGFWGVGGAGFDTLLVAAAVACLCAVCGCRRLAKCRCCRRGPPPLRVRHGSRSSLLHRCVERQWRGYE